MKRLRHLPILLIAALLALSSCDKQEDIDRAYTDFRFMILETVNMRLGAYGVPYLSTLGTATQPVSSSNHM